MEECTSIYEVYAFAPKWSGQAVVVQAAALPGNLLSTCDAVLCYAVLRCAALCCRGYEACSDGWPDVCLLKWACVRVKTYKGARAAAGTGAAHDDVALAALWMASTPGLAPVQSTGGTFGSCRPSV